MADSQKNEKTNEIIEDIINSIITQIEYQTMEETLRRIDDVNEEPTINDLVGLLFYAKLFAGGDYPYEVLQPDEYSRTGPVELIQNDVVFSPAAAQVAVEAPSDEAEFVTPARGAEVKNSFGDLIGWLDPGATPDIRAAPRRRTAARIATAAWRGITQAVRVCCCCSPK